MTVPYILGCLAFREVPFFLKVYETVDTDVDVWFFDGKIKMDIPTIPYR